MQRTVEILLVIGILVNLIKGADLILRPHQQKWVQDKFESLVLWFDYTKPFDWYKSNSGARETYGLILSVIPAIFIFRFALPKNYPSLVLIIFVSAIILLARHPTAPQNNNEEAIKDYEENFYKTVSTPEEHKEPIRKAEARLARWLFSCNTTGQYLIRPFLLTCIGGTAFSLVYGFIHLADTSYRYMASVINPGWGWLKYSLIFLILLICFRVIRYFAGFVFLGFVCLCIFIFTLILITTEALLKIARGITWRIVEYNKGAFAAIILIATIALGVTEFYLKYQPPPSAPVISNSSPTPQ